MISINLKQKKQLSQTVLEPTFNKREKMREGKRERRRKRERKSTRLGGEGGKVGKKPKETKP